MLYVSAGCTLSEPQEKEISKYPGHSVLLPCSCTDPKTKPLSVKWQRVDSGGTEVSNGTELYKDRVHMFNETQPANLSLLISNITKEDQGTYRCTIHNNQSVSITLSVPGPNSTDASFLHKNLDSIVIISVSLLILLLLLGAAVTFWRCGKGRKKRNKAETGRGQSDEDAIIYTTVTHRGNPKPKEEQDNVTYSTVAHGKKAKPAATEEDVTYSSLVIGKKGTTPKIQVEENVTYSDVAFRRQPKSAKQEDVTYATVASTR
ncbi:uncharacterized protein [Hoplias malabaricus]|uniref:uncharacterized protein n=1 Tax=Hoplias malabaricus TaxID=27720 RepID=UPI003462184D